MFQCESNSSSVGFYCKQMKIFVARHLTDKHKKMKGGKLEDRTHYTTTRASKVTFTKAPRASSEVSSSPL